MNLNVFKQLRDLLRRAPRAESQSNHDSGRDWAIPDAEALIKSLRSEVQQLRAALYDLKEANRDEGLLRIRYATRIQQLSEGLRVERVSHRLTLASLERFVMQYGITEVVDTTALAQAQAQMRKHLVNYSNLGGTNG